MMRKNNVELGEYKEGIFRVPTVSGSFMAITRKCIEKNKGFEKNFFMYGEEDDLCLRRNRQTLWGGYTDANPKLLLNDT